jgi:hypothetical protein
MVSPVASQSVHRSEYEATILLNHIPNEDCNNGIRKMALRNLLNEALNSEDVQQ